MSATLKWSRGDGRAPVLRSLGNLRVESGEGLEVACESKAWKALVFGAECRVLEWSAGRGTERKGKERKRGDLPVTLSADHITLNFLKDSRRHTMMWEQEHMICPVGITHPSGLGNL